MKTNEIFDLKRFGKYFGSDLKTLWSNFGLSLMTTSLALPLVIYIISIAFNKVINNTWCGPSMDLRLFVFAMAMFCIIVTMPVKCYGRITEKQYGSFWITLPASRLEKYLSMIILTCIIIPFAGAFLCLGMDAIICAIDHSCGSSIISSGIDLIRNMEENREITINLMNESLEIRDAEVVRNIVNQLSSPWLYIDEIFGITLPILLGAIFFKRGKTAKTFLSLFALGSLLSMMMTPIMVNWTKDIMSAVGSGDPELVLAIFDSGIFRNMVIIDIISDTIFNSALLLGIWFRIKTLKH